MTLQNKEVVMLYLPKQNTAYLNAYWWFSTPNTFGIIKVSLACKR